MKKKTMSTRAIKFLKTKNYLKILQWLLKPVGFCRCPSFYAAINRFEYHPQLHKMQLLMY